MVEISKYGSGEGPGRVTGPGYSTGNDRRSPGKRCVYESHIPGIWTSGGRENGPFRARRSGRLSFCCQTTTSCGYPH